MKKLFCLFFIGILACSHKIEVKKTEPLIKPFGVKMVFYNNCNESLQTYLSQQVSLFYGCTVTMDTSQNLPKEAYYKPRQRFNAFSLLKHLKTVRDTFDVVLGITDKDISIPNKRRGDYGIFGLATPTEKTCVISSYRLSKDSLKCLHVALHEVGHIRGLPHCSSNKECFMKSAKGRMIITTKQLCESCTLKLKILKL